MRTNLTRNYLYAFFKDFSFFSAVLVPFFTNWGHISLFQIQLLQSWFSLWVFALEVPTGALADKLGRKHSIALGSLVVAIAVFFYGLFPNFYAFLFAEFLFALGYAFTSGADEALLYDTLKEEGREDESKKILGKANAIHLLGMSSAAVIGSVIAEKIGINAPTYLTAIPMLLAAVIGWSIKEPKIHSEGSESPSYSQIIKTGFNQMKTKPILRSLAIDSILVSSAGYFIIWFYQPLLESVSTPLKYFGYFHALLLLTQILISANFSFLERYLGKNNQYLKSTAITTALAFILVAIYPSLYTVIIFIMVGGGLGLTRATYIVGLAGRHIGSRERATVLSSIGMLRRLTLVILNPVIGYLATKSLPFAIMIVGLLPFGSFLVKNQEEVV